MAKYGEPELSILRRALDAYPEGIDSPDDHESAEYTAFVRLYDAELIGSKVEPIRFRGIAHARFLRCTITEAGRDVLDEVNQRMGDIAPGDEPMLLGLKEGRDIIIRHVRNLHRASNELGIRITIEEVNQATAQVEKSGPKVIRRLFTEWIPQSMASSTFKAVFDKFFG